MEKTYKLPKVLAVAASVFGVYACETSGCASYQSQVGRISMQQQRQVEKAERPAQTQQKSLDKLF